MLDMSGQIGVVAPGRRADLVIWSGDPLDVLSRVERAFIGGMSRNEQDGAAKIWIKHVGMRHQQRTGITFSFLLR